MQKNICYDSTCKLAYIVAGSNQLIIIKHITMQAEKKNCYLDEYKIIKTLGAGYHATVELGMDDNGNLYAIKRYKKQTANLSTLQHELNIMKVLQHENLVRLIDVRENSTYKREDESTFDCFAIILEYIGGGELFDFIAQTGKFSEKVARTYFHQMMNGLHYMHNKGYAHRDIKPENILLGRDFVLKLADFGFSEMIRGKDGSGILHTKLGTEGYMAPEIPTKNYEGAKTDIFAAGVILFIMYAGNPPFEKAAVNDPYYKLIKDKNYATFWKAHSRRRPLNYFSDTFKNIFERMVAYNPNERPTMKQIAEHPWVNNEVCTQSEIKQEFEVRLQRLSEILEQRRIEQQSQRSQRNGNNQMGVRGELDLEQEPFMDIYENQQENKRTLGHLEPLTADDFIINENSAYAFSVLQNFFKFNQIALEDENEVLGSDILSLKPTEIKDNHDNISAKYELNYEVQGVKFSESVEIKVAIGTNKDNLAVHLTHISGNRLYYKKIAKELKQLYAYCLV